MLASYEAPDAEVATSPVDLNIEDAAEATPELLGRAARFVTRLADLAW
jgi:hypothetical protein